MANPRHVEVQVFGDNHGNVVHLFERDCSIQRRHQKIIEEAPAPNIAADVRQSMQQAAINAAKAINYSGAGTIEFLLEDNAFYFMEMNTRLQVEHPVTEQITGIDLVAWQIAVAQNKPLPLKQAEITCKGHAIEVRVYAEDPEQDFLPQTGTITTCQWPTTSKNIRIDSDLQTNDAITINYDPMIAKVISHGPNRLAAISSLTEALSTTTLTGVRHNISFLSQILNQAAFKEAKLTTHYLTEHPIANHDNNQLAALLLASFQYLDDSTDNKDAWQQMDGWQLNSNNMRQFAYQQQNEEIEIHLTKLDKTTFQSKVNNYQQYQAWVKSDIIFIDNGQHVIKARIYQKQNTWYVFFDQKVFSFAKPLCDFQPQEKGQGSLLAPMPGTIISIDCQINDNVLEKQVLMIVEAMKMEHRIEAPFAGTIEQIFFNAGDQVSEGQELLSIHSIME